MNQTTAENLQESIDKVRALKSTTLDSIREQFGRPTADAVEAVTELLMLSSAVIGISDSDPITGIMIVDLLSRGTALSCGLAEKAFGLTKDQMRTAVDMAKELHTKMLQLAPK